MPYRIKAVVPRFYRSQTRGASGVLSAFHKKHTPDGLAVGERVRMQHDDPDYNEQLAILSCWRNWQCRPIEPERLPPRLFLKIDDPPLLDLYTPTSAGNAFVASERLHALIEAHEPDMHQFVPVALATRKGEHVDAPYFYLVNQRCAVGVNFKRSESAFEAGKAPPEFRRYRYKEPDLHGSKKTFDPQHNLLLPLTVVMRRAVVGSFHLWREVAPIHYPGNFTYDDNTLFMSDALFTEVMTQGLHGLAASHRAVFDDEQ